VTQRQLGATIAWLATVAAIIAIAATMPQGIGSPVALGRPADLRGDRIYRPAWTVTVATAGTLTPANLMPALALHAE